MVNVRSNPLLTADALFYDMSLDKELDNVILPLLDDFQEEPLEETSFLGNIFSEIFDEPLPDYQRWCVKDNKTSNSQHSRQKLFNQSCHWECPSCSDHNTEICVSGTITNSIEESVISSAVPKYFGKNSEIVCETFSPREKAVSQATFSGSDLVCDSEGDDPIPVVLDIKNLKAIYQKKTRKTSTGFEHRLVNSIVNMTVTAQAQIRCVKCYVRRCLEAAKRTHDTIGPVELKVIFDDHEPNITHFSVDLDSVYKTPSGDLIYWLEKAEVEERNIWELIITVEFIDGTEGHFTSRPFQIRTKSGKSRRTPNESRVETPSQQMTQWIGSCGGESRSSSTFTSSSGSSPVRSMASSSPDGQERERMFDVMLERFACEYQQGSIHTGKTTTVAEEHFQKKATPEMELRTIGRVLFCHDSTLDTHTVAQHYNKDERLCGAFEQPDVRGMLKLVGKKTAGRGERRRANGFRAAEEEFWWSCGVCFFERKKKSTVKAHVEQKVCQKTPDRKETKRKHGKRTKDEDDDVSSKRPCRTSFSNFTDNP